MLFYIGTTYGAPKTEEITKQQQQQQWRTNVTGVDLETKKSLKYLPLSRSDKKNVLHSEKMR